MTLTNARTGLVLGNRIDEARGFFGRFRGLLGRSALAPGEGLWIEPCSSIHMFGMRFAIDAAFLDREWRVVRLHEELRPGRIASGGRGARVVVELPAGAIRASDTRVGDALVRLD
jgi:uncharacterized protein